MLLVRVECKLQAWLMKTFTKEQTVENVKDVEI